MNAKSPISLRCHPGLATLLLAVSLAAACTDSTSPLDDSTGDSPRDLKLTGLEPIDVDGTWIFSHKQKGGAEVRHSGVPRIDDACLWIGDRVVIWPELEADHAKSLLNSAHSLGAAAPEVTVGGGLVNLPEELDERNDAWMDVVLSRCPSVTAVFAASSVSK